MSGITDSGIALWNLLKPASTTATPDTLALRDSTGGSAFNTLEAGGKLTSKNVLHTNNQVVNKVITLYDGGDPNNRNATDFFGFGINSGTLRYQVPSGSNYHTFFNGGTACATITTNGLYVNSGGIFLMASAGGGSPSQLTHYEEYEFWTTFTGCGRTTRNMWMFIVRCGRQVTLTVMQGTEASFANCTALGTFVSDTALPARFYHNNNSQIFQSVMIVDGNVNKTGLLIIDTDGKLSIGTYTGSFVNGQPCGFYSFTVSWSVYTA